MKSVNLTTSDNNTIYGTILEPNCSPKAVVYLVHGMCEHKERYKDFTEFLVKNGYITIIFDLRGHGRNTQKEKLGYFGDKRNLINDVDIVMDYIKEEYPNLKIILFGHSMGSLIIKNNIQNNDNKIDKLILCGPPTKNYFVEFGIIISNLIGLFKGEYHRSKFINNLSIGSYNKGFNKKNEWLVKNIKVLDDYNDDEYCGFIFTINGFKSLFYMLKNAYISKKYEVNNKDLSILLIGGKEDKVIVSEKKFKHLLQFFNKIGYNKIKSKIFENMRHEILSEEDNKLVYKVILDFLNN